MNKLHYIIPMAGRGSRFFKNGYSIPKPLIEIYGKPFFYWATRSIEKYINIISLDFVVLKEHIEKFDIKNHILSYFPYANIHILNDVTEGAVITCLKGIENINDNLPVLFNDCDHLFKSTYFIEFCYKQNIDIDGIILTFNSNEPKYSFIKKDSFGNVICTKEKKVISNEAICGCYYFKSSQIFKHYAKNYLDNCQYKEFFMSGVYNEIIKDKKIVKSFNTDFHVSFGTPEEYNEVLNDKNYKELL